MSLKKDIVNIIHDEMDYVVPYTKLYERAAEKILKYIEDHCFYGVKDGIKQVVISKDYTKDSEDGI